MKNKLFIIAILIANVTFAGSSIDEKSAMLLNMESNLEIITEHFDDDGCTVSCYATATNRDTGRVMYFEASSTSSDCASATMDCYGKAMKQALEFIRQYEEGGGTN
ncbi:hypothetical protein [Gelidibacter japonicus]|uniref:hypothetical protein n=1 Tax=Gelidibacter japonicus TaxID=1962232 RepID=UPI0013D761B1|nr:hypothetical protein [Gelidibacter japonicus]